MPAIFIKPILAALAAGASFIAIALIASRFFEAEHPVSPGPPPAEPAAAADAPTACLPSGDGFFQARIDGAIEARIDWANAGTLCEGDPRPDGKGIRLSFTRRSPEEDTVRLLVVFGISGVSEGSTGTALPMNLTVIDEKHNRVFGTLGENKCTMDRLEQTLIGAWSKDARAYRVTGRGFCMQPARSVAGDEAGKEAGSERILMSTFDFAGKVVYR